MMVIGLTGGIGSGKSEVTRHFETLNVPVYDADVIAKSLVEPEQPALKEIIDKFGPDIITSDGELDRTQLRNIVFNKPQQRQILEKILHPKIRQSILHEINHCKAIYCIVCMPLLLETRQTDLVDRILVIDVDEKQQINQVKQRDNITNKEVATITSVQYSRQKRLTYADDVILNNSNLFDLHHKVEELHKNYCVLAEKY
ncbi:MAG: dephospho-CoA kinase [Methylococcales bacterium]|mgnify:CR=1 FL=1|jgi:dephospho-CoA kinase|nr:dephospho-CoA kinase [Methylococcales bacterium]MBT7409092.1 dephospho-CoA kinase [Methylococcales bacterium]